jgi:uncharacterized protein (TIGR03437 family)
MQSDMPSAFGRRKRGPILLCWVLITVSKLAAQQQYCISGTVSSTNCSNCGFQMGDPVAMTFTAESSSIACVSSPVGSQCVANATFSANIGGTYWTNPEPQSSLNFSGSSSESLAILSGTGYRTPNPTPPMAAPSVQITFEMSALPPNSFPTNALPTTLPSSSAAASSNASVAFQAIVSSPLASASLSYAGQNCAMPPTVPPVITPSGIVPLFSSATTIQPGSWASIFGTNLASAPATWMGDFPTSLAGTSVTINGKPAYLWYVSPTQINMQAPDDMATGPVNVVVTTGGGTGTSTVTLGQFGPSFSLLDSKHVAGIILRSNGTGAYGGGSYDIVGPTGSSLGYATVAAKAGDVLELFGVGFGPTSPQILAGQVYSGAASTTNPVTLTV